MLNQFDEYPETSGSQLKTVEDYSGLGCIIIKNGLSHRPTGFTFSWGDIVQTKTEYKPPFR